MLNKVIFLILIFILGCNQFTKEIETPIYVFPKKQCQNSYENVIE